MQWIDSVLSKGNAVDFFHDEFRCPAYVKDVVSVILALSEKWKSGMQSLKIHALHVGYGYIG